MPPGVPPINLFRTIANHPVLLEKLRGTGTYLLNHGTLDPFEREIVIHRTCARCGCEYEWGVHAAFFARPLGFSDDQIAATVLGDASDRAWAPRQSLLIRLVDELHDTARVPDDLWKSLKDGWTAEQLVELVALVGQYHSISFTANAFGVELEDFGERFPQSNTK
jgi:alkylhydroperoxidase family enzyme